MKIFTINNKKKEKIWHFLQDGGNSYCGNATTKPVVGWQKQYTRTIKEFDNEKMCPACVGKVYQTGKLNISIK